MKIVCSFCGEEIDPTGPATWHRVVGWERKATASSRKSGSDIALREARDEHAHDLCVRRAQSGVAPMQQAFL